MKLKVEDLTIKVEKRVLLSGVNFEFHEGQLVGLVGASGCGKTTLLNTLGLLLPAHSGSIFYDGSNATKWRQRQISKFWREQASFVIQDAGIDDDETVVYNVTLKKSFFGRNPDQRSALEALEKVGLSQRAHDTARVLSGGEQRRVAIARSMYRKSHSSLYLLTTRASHNTAPHWSTSKNIDQTSSTTTATFLLSKHP